MLSELSLAISCLFGKFQRGDLFFSFFFIWMNSDVLYYVEMITRRILLVLEES